MKPEEIEQIILRYSEGATDRVADGVLYKNLALAIALRISEEKAADIKSDIDHLLNKINFKDQNEHPLRS